MDFAFRFSRWQSWSFHRSCAKVKPVRASALSCAKPFAIAFAIGGAIIPDGIVNHYGCSARSGFAIGGSTYSHHLRICAIWLWFYLWPRL